MSRHLVAGQIFAHVRSHFVAPQLSGSDDERCEHLPEGLVRHTDDGDLANTRMMTQQLFDLDGEHVLRTGDDHVVLAALDEQPAVLEAPNVTGRKQPTLFFLAAARRVTAEPHRTADEDASNRTRRNGPTFVVEDFDGDA